ncbi:MAG: hypothetical protein EA361_13960 [Bacteroidetes bacterium]|nr:MAG: hypothetical protein EA361_13960 [Bacteroidota bacterium]
MTHPEKKIIESYTGLIESLSSIGKLELLEKLARSIRLESKSREEDFFNSFGAFVSKKSAEDISNEIKASRSFRKKNLKF